LTKLFLKVEDRNMSRVIEPVPCVGIRAADLVKAEAMLEDYHRLFTPLLLVESKLSTAIAICEG
jgi:hypothetical protein